MNLRLAIHNLQTRFYLEIERYRCIFPEAWEDGVYKAHFMCVVGSVILKDLIIDTGLCDASQVHLVGFAHPPKSMSVYESHHFLLIDNSLDSFYVDPASNGNNQFLIISKKYLAKHYPITNPEIEIYLANELEARELLQNELTERSSRLYPNDVSTESRMSGTITNP